ncbi:MAG TPA: type II 3-dehydroquinate dehydratase [Clostridia bacterium]|nr:type II 3-dehydroquinate dehydratase [Clostridia bacterium]
MMNILVINGPNLNQLGKRDENHYGSFTLDDLMNQMIKNFPEVNFDFFQSNYEGAIIDELEKYETYDGIIINPGAFTHYSYAIRDCIESIPKIIIEVHISNVYNREDFRKESVVSPVCTGKISGLGKYSYILAVEYIVNN